MFSKGGSPRKESVAGRRFLGDCKIEGGGEMRGVWTRAYKALDDLEGCTVIIGKRDLAASPIVAAHLFGMCAILF